MQETDRRIAVLLAMTVGAAVPSGPPLPQWSLFGRMRTSAPTWLPLWGPIPLIKGKCPEGTKGIGILARRSRD